MTETRFATTPTAQAVLLADRLRALGWAQQRPGAGVIESGARVIRLDAPPGSAPVHVLISTDPGVGCRLAEIFCRPSAGRPRSGRGKRPSWRMSVFNAPSPMILAVARIAAEDADGPTFDTAAWEGWETCAIRSASGRVEKRDFVHPTGQVSATYFQPHAPGESGGWLISGPDSYADATGHTPGPIVRATADALLVR